LRAFVRKVVMARCVDYLRRRRPAVDLEETELADPRPDPDAAVSEEDERGL